MQVTQQMKKRADEILSGMTPEQRVGQVFLAHCPEGDGKALIEKYQFGGMLAFAREFQDRTPDEARKLFAGYNSVSQLPLLLAADEEGGRVVRISKFPQYGYDPFPSPRALFERAGWEGIEEDARKKAKMFRELGMNYDLAPVCDYTTDESVYIFDRVFGRSPEESARFVELTVRAMEAEGVACSLKHFPGYGGNSDTHRGMSRDVRPIEVFEKEDLLPFAAGIRAAAASVMVSHNIVDCFDPDYPSSLSEPVHRYLRKKMGFDGVIITDSLTMSAVTEFAGGQDPCVRALLCGNDMIITSHYVRGAESVLAALRSGLLPENVLDGAVRRVLCMKLSMGLLH